jgi:catechol 2,3-dioxygenase-like lactoylglutathione lyase family enzyme
MSTPKSSYRLRRLGLTTANLDQLAQFYEDAFDCRRTATEQVNSPDFEALMKVEGGAKRAMLFLGLEAIECVQFDNPGRPYPANSSAADLIFQHFAIVVSDMAKAFQRLCAVEGWTSITQGGPQRLPDSSGGVMAFKFRDPEGHPLELLAFPAGSTPTKWRIEREDDIFLGIDHSAICVADTAISSAFYENLGFTVSGHSLNRGAEQDKLDDLLGVQVKVTTLLPAGNGPHVELLCYQPVTNAPRTIQRNNDVAATRLILEPSEPSPIRSSLSIFDPDGHHLTIVPVP